MPIIFRYTGRLRSTPARASISTVRRWLIGSAERPSCCGRSMSACCWRSTAQPSCSPTRLPRRCSIPAAGAPSSASYGPMHGMIGHGAAPTRQASPIKASDAFERLAGDRCRAGGREFIEAAADVGPAEGEFYVTALGEHTVATIAVDLQDALEASEMGNWPLGLAIRRIHIGDAWRVGAAPWPIIPCIGP